MYSRRSRDRLSMAQGQTYSSSGKFIVFYGRQVTGALVNGRRRILQEMKCAMTDLV